MSGWTVIASFFAFLLAISALGVVASLKQHTKSTADYLLADRSVPAWLAALSAVATNNSGFMFIGLIGYTYRFGVEAVWMMLGWIVGDWLAWTFVHPKVRRESGRVGATTVPSLIGHRPDRSNRVIVVITAVLTLAFLGAYAAAQLKAGSTALQTLFGWDPRVGAVLGAAIVVAYCFAGGIRASIWTDAAQSLVMIGSMMVLIGYAIAHVGGLDALTTNLASQDEQLTRWMPGSLRFGFVPYLLGMTAGGFGAIGQPHILVRFMALESPDSVGRAKLVYFAWFVPFFALAILVGLYSRALLPELVNTGTAAGLSASAAAEFAMPELARMLLPDVLLGLILAGLFSATMSTADSQILVCSGCITQDIVPQWRESYLASKLATLGIAGVALAIALSAHQGVFSLVLIAWSALGATLGPVLIARLYGFQLSTTASVVVMASGLATVMVWNASGLDGDVFKLLPGLIVPAVFLIVLTRFGPRRIEG